jgi:hypothetical protein
MATTTKRSRRALTDDEIRQHQEERQAKLEALHARCAEQVAELVEGESMARDAAAGRPIPPIQPRERPPDHGAAAGRNTGRRIPDGAERGTRAGGEFRGRELWAGCSPLSPSVLSIMVFRW